MDQPGFLVEDRDRQVLGAENLADLVADGVDDRVVFELLRERRTYLVDDGELRVALLGLGEQVLRLVEETSVLQSHTKVRCDRGQQSLIGLAERVLLHALEADHAEHSITREHRHTEPRFGVVGAEDVCAESGRFLGGAQPQRFPWR